MNRGSLQSALLLWTPPPPARPYTPACPLALAMPADDGSQVGFFKFVADEAGDLSSGEEDADTLGYPLPPFHAGQLAHQTAGHELGGAAAHPPSTNAASAVLPVPPCLLPSQLTSASACCAAVQAHYRPLNSTRPATRTGGPSPSPGSPWAVPTMQSWRWGKLAS